MKSLLFSLHSLKLDTAIKVMSYPLTLNFRFTEVEEVVVERLQQGEELAELNSRDLLSLCNYFSKVPTEGADTLLEQLLPTLEQTLMNTTELQQLADIADCLHYCSHKRVYSTKFNTALFTALANLPKVTTEPESIKQAAVAVAKSIAAHFGLEQLEIRIEEELKGDKMMACFTRLPAFICYSYQSDSRQSLEGLGIPPSLLFPLSTYSYKPLPMQLQSPAMDTK